MKFQLLLPAAALAASSFAFSSATSMGAAAADDCPSSCAKTARAALASSPVSDKNIVETAVAAGSFTTLATLLGKAELIDALSGEGPFTVFAPVDAAFAKIDPKTVESLLKKENKAALQDILKFHVVSGKVMAKDVVKLTNATTLNGQRVDIRVDEGTVYIDGAKVTTVDIECSNGVIHVIDTVVMPVSQNLVEVAAGAKSFGTLLAAAKAAGLAETLAKRGPFTIFAPNDEAFAKLPKGTVESLLKPENKDQLIAILKHHVVSGRVYADQAAKLDKAPTIGGTELAVSITREAAMIGGAKILATDIEASNGVIHVIDSVLLPE